MKYSKEVRTRVGWLSVGLLASLLIAHLIHCFENVLEQNLILAAFIPLIVYMGDAVGTQMEAIIIRDLNHKKSFKFRHFFSRQLAIILPVAVIISIAAAGVVYLWKDDQAVSVVIGISLFISMVSSIVTGAVLPYFFWKLHEDPAEASGPIATVIQDFLSILIFFTVARILLGY